MRAVFTVKNVVSQDPKMDCNDYDQDQELCTTRVKYKCSELLDWQKRKKITIDKKVGNDLEIDIMIDLT